MPRASSGSRTTGASPRRNASTRAFAAAEGGKRLGEECFMGPLSPYWNRGYSAVSTPCLWVDSAEQAVADADRPCNRSRAYAFAAFAAFTMISATGFGCET
jgi:hypothetical protein